MNNVKILIIDDKCKAYKDSVRKKECFHGHEIMFFDFSNIDVISDYNNTRDSHIQLNDVDIRDQTKTQLDLIFNAVPPTPCQWLVLLDYELCYWVPYGKEAEHTKINADAREGVIDSIKSRDNVFLVLFTSAAPEDLGLYYEELYDRMLNPAEHYNMKLFYRFLELFFNAPPLNYEYLIKDILQPEIKTIQIIGEEGLPDDCHWASATKPFND